MAQSIITDAFSVWLATHLANNTAARPDTLVFAYVDGQDENAEIDATEGLPAAEAIRHPAAITQFGTLNDSAVVCSVVLDSTVGDWDYNWIGLLDSTTGTVLMIVHTATQQKIRTQGGVQGNSLTRNLCLQFSGAAAAMQINVTAETWMVDYSARLQSMDESRRLTALDHYGPAAFQDDSFLVTLDGATARVQPGLAYVAGLRATLDTPATLGAGNTGIWLDVSWQGTVTGAWSVHVSLRAADSLSDYTDDAGIAHHVTQIAAIAGGAVTDLRTPFPLDALRDDLDSLSGNVDVLADAVYTQSQVDDLLTTLTETLLARCPHEVGDVLFRGNDDDPNAKWPETTWQDMSGSYDGRNIAIGTAALATGGNDEVTLTSEQMPIHGHGFSGTTDEAGAWTPGLRAYSSNTALDGGTSNRFSVDSTFEHTATGDLISSAPAHSHTFSGTTNDAGGGQPFSVVSRYLHLRAWLRTA